MTVRAVVAEDEAILRQELVELLGQVWPELKVVALAEDGLQAVHALDKHRPEVLFLDIHMPGLSGLDVARHASGKAHIVFITAFDQYAVTAFEQGAVDYVMKPVTAGRLLTTIDRLKQRLSSAPSNLDGLLNALAERRAQAKPTLRWISASQGNDVKLVTLEEVLFFRSDSKYTRVVTATNDLLIRKSVKELLDELDPEVFWQIHRSTIVNVNAIAAVTRDIAGHIQLKLKNHREALPVSQPFAHLFRQM
jgi:DNA-binding LytR/AlgR family response regulator